MKNKKENKLKTKKLEDMIDVEGRFYKVCDQLIPETILEASKICKRNQNNENWIPGWSSYVTGTGFIYAVEKNQPVVYVTNTEFNPIFKGLNYDRAIEDIRDCGNYEIKNEDYQMIREKAKKGEESVKRFVMSDLKLTECGEQSYYRIDTKKYGTLNKAQREFAEMIYGTGKQFESIMKLAEESTEDIRIILPNLKEVEIWANGSPLAGIGRMDCFSVFIAGYCHNLEHSDVYGINRKKLSYQSLVKHILDSE